MPSPMSHDPARRRAGHVRRWLGWSRDTPVVGIEFDRDELRLLCLRRGSAISAVGRVALPPGTVRGGRLRVPEPAVEALTALRSHLHLPATSRLVQVVQPRTTGVEGGGSVVGRLEVDEVAIRHRVARAAGFDHEFLDPAPAAVDRVVGAGGEPRYSEGAGWRVYRDGDHLEVEPSDRDLDEILVGPTPVDRNPLTLDRMGRNHPGGPIAVDRGVRLLDRWQLLVGAALADGPHHPARVEELAPAPTGSWTVERVDGGLGGGRS